MENYSWMTVRKNKKFHTKFLAYCKLLQNLNTNKILNVNSCKAEGGKQFDLQTLEELLDFTLHRGISYFVLLTQVGNLLPPACTFLSFCLLNMMTNISLEELKTPGWKINDLCSWYTRKKLLSLHNLIVNVYINVEGMVLHDF